MTDAGLTRTGGREATTGHIVGDCAIAVGMPDAEARPGWRWRLLTDLARLESGHTPSRRHPEYWDGDIPWIGIRDATGNHGLTLQDTEQHVTQEGIDNSSARVLPTHTVCLSRTASVGYVVVMGRPMATSQDFVNWVCDPELLDYRYLKYALLAERTSYSRFSHGTTHQTIYFPEVKAFHLCAPSLDTQSSIADVLSALDDKVEQNRRTARVLERLARAIFRTWFVDFEPVKAKAAGATTFPSMPQPIFDALPARFVDSDIGPVPEGWEVKSFGDLLVLQYGKALKAEDRQPGSVPVFGSNGQVGWHDESIAAGPGIIVGRKGNPGTVTWSQGPFFPIDTAFFVQLVDARASLPLLFHQLHAADLGRLAADSAVPGVNRNMIYGERCVLPCETIRAAFDGLVFGLWELQTGLMQESGKLCAMGDYLLPKLLSGTVRVEAAHG